MSEWRENSNGNYVYVIDCNEVMTVFMLEGKWFGAHDDCFTKTGFDDPVKAMTKMEQAVLEGQPGLLERRNRAKSEWHRTKSGSYQRYTGKHVLTVKQAKSGSWFVVVDQVILKDQWFSLAEEAMLQADSL